MNTYVGLYHAIKQDDFAKKGTIPRLKIVIGASHFSLLASNYSDLALRYRKLSSLSAYTKKELHGSISSANKQLAKVQTNLDLTMLVLVFVWLILSVPVVLIVPSIIISKFDLGISPIGWIAILLSIVVGMGVAATLNWKWISGLFRQLTIAEFARLSSPAVFGLIVILIGVYMIDLSNWQFGPRLLLFILAATALSFTILCLIGWLFLGVYLLFQATSTRKASTRSGAVITGQLIEILSDVENSCAVWAGTEFKCKIMGKLERVATRLEHDLPRQLRSGDEFTDHWIMETGQQLAATLRKQKQSLIMSTPSTRNQFMEKIATFLIHFASGNWDELERNPPNSLSRPQIFRSRILRLISGILKAIPPALWLIWPFTSVAQDLRSQIPSETALSITFIAILWILTIFLEIFDPDYLKRLETVQTMKDTFGKFSRNGTQTK